MKYIIDFSTNDETLISDYMTNNQCTVLVPLARLNTYIVESPSLPPKTEIVSSVFVDDDAPISLLSSTPTKTFPIDDHDNWWKLAVLEKIDLDAETATILRGGKNSVVYVMDSGIDHQHPDLEGKDITLLHSFTGEFSDSNGHGTAIASIIVGEQCGITEATLKVIKIFDKNTPTLMSDLLIAMDAVAQDYLQNDDYLAVLNLSWSVEKNTFLEDKIQMLINMGVFVIASAGNEGRPIGDVTPAAIPDVITVGSFGKDLRASDFSNYTPSESEISFTEGATNHGVLDCFAPGEFIRVAIPGGGFGFAMGTSMSAAIVSAIMALRIASSGFNWTVADDLKANDFAAIAVARNILTLEAPHDRSANVVPVSNLSEFTGRHRGVRMGRILAGETQIKWMVNSDVYETIELIGAPDWITMINGYLSMAAPMDIKATPYFFQCRLVNKLGEEEIVDWAMVNAPSEEEIKQYYTEHKNVTSVYLAWTECDEECNPMPYCCSCCGMKGSMSCQSCQNLECHDNVCN